eukprot:365165-Chlamydomonas_euryale.AAC.12
MPVVLQGNVCGTAKGMPTFSLNLHNHNFPPAQNLPSPTRARTRSAACAPSAPCPFTPHTPTSPPAPTPHNPQPPGNAYDPSVTGEQYLFDYIMPQHPDAAPHIQKLYGPGGPRRHGHRHVGSGVGAGRAFRGTTQRLGMRHGVARRTEHLGLPGGADRMRFQSLQNGRRSVADGARSFLRTAVHPVCPRLTLRSHMSPPP